MKASKRNHATGRVHRAGALATFSILLGFGSPAQAQGPLVWASGPDLPSARAEGVAILAPGDAVIVLGGVSPAGDTVVPKLPNGTTNWTTAPALDMSRKSLGAVKYSAQEILVIGGRAGNQPTDETLFYDYSLGDSQDAAQMSDVRQQFAFALDGAGRVYAIGGKGESNQILSTAERYVPSQDEWAGIASLPVALCGATAIGVDTTYVYVFGGATAGGVQATA